MVAEDQDALFSRTFAARRGVFGWADDEEVGGALVSRQVLVSANPLMDDTSLNQFHLAAWNTESQMAPPRPNSYFALLAIVDCWH